MDTWLWILGLCVAFLAGVLVDGAIRKTVFDDAQTDARKEIENLLRELRQFTSYVKGDKLLGYMEALRDAELITQVEYQKYLREQSFIMYPFAQRRNPR